MAGPTLTDTMPELDDLMTWSVDKAFIAAQREIAPVGKDGENKDQRYNFRQAEDVIRVCSGAMRKYGLRIFPARVLSREHQTRGKMNVTIIEVEWAVRGPQGDVMDTPIVTIGEAADASDKATNKAMTASEKYALLQAFKIEVKPGDLDDGDRDHPHGVRSPLDWYLERLRLANVWYSRDELRRVLDVAANNNMLSAPMPDNPQCTLEQYVLMRGRQLVAEEQERERERAEQHEAFKAQMLVEHPTPGPAHDPWAVRPPQPTAGPPTVDNEEVPAEDTEPGEAPPAEERLPEQSEVQALVNGAKADADALTGIRARFGEAVLEQVVISSPWGQISANAAITLALDDIGSKASKKAPTAPRKVTPQEKATAKMLAEAQLQADALGVELHEHLAPVLPPGETDTSRLTSRVELQKLIAEQRPRTLAALIKAGHTAAAELYSRLGVYVPAANIDKIVAAVEADQPA
ncbi:ERF family protein [Streptomyces sp. NPDC088915]|uniref:ERF family protein n=1 Tax=Streptomyces sp. NPDC088915 TaxID=3365912 RepID=UPI00381674B8